MKPSLKKHRRSICVYIWHRATLAHMNAQYGREIEANETY